MSRDPWDFEKALEEDREFERHLPLKELAVLVLVLAVVSVRLFLA